MPEQPFEHVIYHILSCKVDVEVSLDYTTLMVEGVEHEQEQFGISDLFSYIKIKTSILNLNLLSQKL